MLSSGCLLPSGNVRPSTFLKLVVGVVLPIGCKRQNREKERQLDSLFSMLIIEMLKTEKCARRIYIYISNRVVFNKTIVGVFFFCIKRKCHRRQYWNVVIVVDSKYKTIFFSFTNKAIT